MPGRSRSRQLGPSAPGVYLVNNVPQAYGSTDNLGGMDCTDVVGNPHGDNPLSINSWIRRIAPLNGKGYGYLGNYYEYRDYAIGINPLVDYGHLSVDMPNVDTTAVLAQTNPSRMDNSPLELIQDIVDLPRQLRDIDRLLRTPKKRKLLNAKELANQNLALQFGWLPFISDVRKLFDFQASVHRRTEELHKLFSNQGLRRRVSLGEASASASYGQQWSAATFAGIISGVVDKQTMRRRWATVRWSPSVLPPLYPDTQQQLKLARQVVSGLSLEGLGRGAWNVLPWTWLIDWFSSTGNFISSYSNTVPATPGSVCIMDQTTTIVTYRRSDDVKIITGWDGEITYESKSRSVGGASLSASLPYVGVNRLSILGSLAVQRLPFKKPRA